MQHLGRRYKLEINSNDGRVSDCRLIATLMYSDPKVIAGWRVVKTIGCDSEIGFARKLALGLEAYYETDRIVEPVKGLV